MPEKPPAPNVIIFGETGSGKSSVINMISQTYVAPISSGATGCTFNYVRYPVEIQGAPFNLYDTAGLDEGDHGKVAKQDAIAQLYKLIVDLEGGVSLLVFCMRGPRIKEAAHKNWRLFHEVFCKKNVPIVIVITGLEQEDPMDNWWRQNKAAFHKYGMVPSGNACITATRGRQNRSGRYVFEDEYEESRVKVSKLIEDSALAEPWKVNRIQWFSEITICLMKFRLGEAPEIREMATRCSMSNEEARELAERLRGV
ncbi:P-loop containing nucleoside triphosphate hydrolase protein [Leucogyrophana mollusca]|uniref:P-loop containing nucleoside triphosphate hydrolase protein n=1 Tax=Leucogyrophana mollusca TaxID=85980 RepID=A0ACB8BIZ6_9AGAM|nr:P-loop containing nucleoside triphosphate hydrolase protein [Leucogyrophana mollusca]